MPSLEREARTVLSIAEHFDRLKRAAVALRETVGARDRGYFTPTEDEQTRRLVVSYTQSRNALLDLVFTLKQQREDSGTDHPLLFLVGFTAAAVLVDAARFGRERFGDSEVIREKLNEAEPHFGIPPGTYDAVMLSLTSPVNAWLLYQAGEHFEEHRAEIETTARVEPLMQDVWKLLQSLHHRVEVSATEYAAARVGVRARQVSDAIARSAIGRLLYALQEIAGRVIADVSVQPGHESSMPSAIVERIESLLEPGDVLVTRKEHALTNYFLPGFWPHASLYLGDPDTITRRGLADHELMRPRWSRLVTLDADDPHRVVEAQKDGVWIRSLRSPLTNDAMAVIRPRLDLANIDRALARTLSHEGKAYDFDFDFSRSDRLVCTEVVYRAYEGIGDVRFELTRRAGRMTLSAEDLLRMAVDRRHFDPVAVFAPTHREGLATGRSALDLLVDTIPRP
ncbi:MAG: hypothetical protein CMJ18_17400 [Phycisphaeraceae bacterium]|nr:hypothetical protein [Phycisphaeraceae bacterium]